MNLNFYKSLTTFSHGKAVSKFLMLLIAVAFSSSLFAQTEPNAPTNVTASPAAVCIGSSTNLRAISAGNQIKWYTDPTGGSYIGTSNSGANFSVSPSTATVYYAESFSVATSLSSVSRTAIAVQVNIPPQITSVPADVMQTNEAGRCGSVINYPPVTVTGVPLPSVIYSNPSGSDFGIGTTTVLTTAINTCGSSSLSFDVTVVDNESPVIVSPPNKSVNAPAGATTVSGVDLGAPTVSDNCGETTVTNNAPSAFPGGTTVVTWTVTDSHGHATYAFQNVTIIISNTAPELNSITSSDADNVVAQYSSISLNISWNDEATGGPYSLDVDWRDSSTHSVLNGITSHNAAPSHTYNKTGVFSPVIKITDGSGAKDTIAFKYLVVYIVGNYSTTAQGFFTAPYGSLVSNPTLTTSRRKVEYGVECKPNPCHPGDFDGEVEIDMDGGKFEFETENIDWDYLAVSACFLATFQGTGYLYPQGHHYGCHGRCHGGCCGGGGHHYGILIVQSDKYKNSVNANKVRIKIWDITNGNAVVFDTQMGDADYALPTTALSSGSIRVKVPNNCVARLDETDGMVFNTSAFTTVVAPNPFNTSLSIDVTSAWDDEMQVEIYDMVGKLIQTVPDIAPNEPFTLQTDFPVGAYFVRISQNGISQVVKVVKE